MAFRTPFTPLYADVLDYLNRGSTIRGLPSIAGIFDDYDASKNNRLGIFDEEETTTKPIVPVGIPAAPMNQMRDGADNRTGFGAFGNLDKNDVKYFQDEYGNLVKGYRNVTSGLYQTEDGKNVQGILDEYEYTSTGSLREPPGQISTGIGSYSPDVIGAMTSNNAYRGIALKAAEDTRLEQKLAEERLQREKEKQAAIEEAKRIAAEKERQRLQQLGQYKDRGGFDPSGPTQQSIRNEREDKSGRGQSGGFTNPGKGSYGPHS